MEPPAEWGERAEPPGTGTIEPDAAVTGPDARAGPQSRVRRAAC
ncbi:hypothetical protein SAOR_08395 [Salinisphaera orenii MK-B5]|uniref:Uncharacterized protein n=1 Tax=Salinisphaera orenii MK-B5 TaxID=856730 RepID=A0A423PQL2_9GAMM|nr:hypothetical protein SAOR_08395 [Salinisphaera orenii MK-B5]